LTAAASSTLISSNQLRPNGPSNSMVNFGDADKRKDFKKQVMVF
jgi:hypothetical protein